MKYEYEGNHVLFMYLRDPNESRRVATLARAKVGDKVVYAWAINRFTNSGIMRGRYDFFTKAKGREIAYARLKGKAHRVVYVSDNDRPIKAMLRDIVLAPVDSMYNGREYNNKRPTVPQRLVSLAKRTLAEVEAGELEVTDPPTLLEQLLADFESSSMDGEEDDFDDDFEDDDEDDEDWDDDEDEDDWDDDLEEDEEEEQAPDPSETGTVPNTGVLETNVIPPVEQPLVPDPDTN